jgi:HEAT repeat protein
LEPLLGAVSDGSPDVVHSAVESIGKLRDARGMSSLQSLLASDDKLLRRRVVEALGRIQDPATFPALNLLKLHLARALRKLRRRVMASSPR